MIAIGDIHGCLKELEQLISNLPKDKVLIFHGDYIDRGPDSMGVVKYLRELSKVRECVFLRGNHEEMCINAVLKDDEYSMQMWVGNGGIQCVESYGDVCNMQSDVEWMNTLPLYHETETNIHVHAGINCSVKNMADQVGDDLLWIRQDFFNYVNSWEGKRVIFGHTPTKYLHEKNEVFKKEKLIAIDTGCFFSGVLSGFDTETNEVYTSKNWLD